jgi:hypothetical protein
MVLLEELEETCHAINATNPTTPWIFHGGGDGDSDAWIGPMGSDCLHRSAHPQAEGRIVGVSTAPLTIGETSDASEVVIQTEKGRLTISLSHALYPWTFERRAIRINGQSMGEGAGARPGVRAPDPGFRTLHSKRLRRHEDGSLLDFLDAFYWDDSPEYVLADGTNTLKPANDGTVAPMQTMVQSDLEHSQSHDALLARYHKLPSDADRRRVAAYWLGHPHPLLAAVGLTIATTPIPPTHTPTNTPATSPLTGPPAVARR